jgi:hypothetical protein
MDYLDSSDVLANGAELRQRMARDGYLFLRNAMPLDALIPLRDQCLEIVARAGWIDRNRPGEAIANLDAFCVEPMPEFLAVYRQIYRLPAFHAVKQHPQVLAMMERVLGGKVLPHPLALARALFPRRIEVTTPPHQDFVHIGGTEDTITAWFPLMDCTPEMGGLEVAEGSHKEGVRDFEVTLGAGGISVSDPLEGEWRYSPFRLGDVILFHSLAVHRGRPNRSQRLRLSSDCRFQRVNEPVSEVSMQPQGGVCGSWDEVYEGWKPSELQYYWKDMDLTVVPLDRRWYEIRDEMAFKMAEEGDERCRSTLQRVAIRDPSSAKRDRAKRALELLGELKPV